MNSNSLLALYLSLLAKYSPGDCPTGNVLLATSTVLIAASKYPPGDRPTGYVFNLPTGCNQTPFYQLTPASKILIRRPPLLTLYSTSLLATGTQAPQQHCIYTASKMPTRGDHPTSTQPPYQHCTHHIQQNTHQETALSAMYSISVLVLYSSLLGKYSPGDLPIANSADEYDYADQVASAVPVHRKDNF